MNSRNFFRRLLTRSLRPGSQQTIRRQPRILGQFEGALEERVVPATYNELEAAGAIGSNDTRATAEFISFFGSGTDPVADIVGNHANGTDLDFYSFTLFPGDIIGIAQPAAVSSHVTIFDPSGTNVGQSEFDLTGIYPASSPLPASGFRNMSHVASVGGLYTVRLDAFTTGAYAAQLRVFRPVIESQPAYTRQVLFLDYNGATTDAALFGGPNDGPDTLSGLATFLPNWGLTAGNENAVINAINNVVFQVLSTDIGGTSGFGANGEFFISGTHGEFAIEILNSRDHADPFGTRANVSRVIIGGSIAEFGIATIGIAQSIDVGNFDLSEDSVVLLDILAGTGEFVPAGGGDDINAINGVNAGNKIAAIGMVVGQIAAHEAGHFFGNFHTENGNANGNTQDRGGNGVADEAGVGADGIFGTVDDVFPTMGLDIFSLTEGIIGTEDTRNTIAFGLSTGTASGIYFDFVSGTMHVTGTMNNGTADTYRLVRSGANLQVYVNGSLAGTEPIANVLSIEVHGSQDNDTLTIDYSGGAISIPIDFDGGLGFNTLETTNYNVDMVTVNHFASPPGGPFSGNVQVGSGTPLISYSNLSPLVNAGTAANIIYNLPGTNDVALLEDDGIVGNNMSRLTSVNATFETTTFTNPTNSLTVNLGSGSDVLSLVPLDSQWSVLAPTINLNGDGGIDSIQIAATPASTTVNVDTGTGVPGDLLILGATVASGGTVATTFAQFNTGISTLDFLALGSIINFDDGGGVGEIYLDDSGGTTGDNAVLTSGTITGLSPATINYVGANTNIVHVALGSGSDTIDVQSTGADDFAGGNTMIFGNNGNDVFTIAANLLSSSNFFNGDGGNDTFNLNYAAGTTTGQGAVGYGPFSALQINGGDPSSDPLNQDVVNINTSQGGDGARNVGITFLGNGDADVTGLGTTTIDLNSVETVTYAGDAANNDSLVVTGTAGNDVLSVTPYSPTSAAVFLGGNPMTSPPGAPADNDPGVAAGVPGPDLFLSGLQAGNNSGLTLDGGTGNNRLVVNAPTEAVSGADQGAAWNAAAFGGIGSVVLPAGQAFDRIVVRDTRVEINNTALGGDLVRVNYATATFSGPALQDVVVNSGEEALGAATIADDIRVFLSTAIGFQINGGQPLPPGSAPLRGDRLLVDVPNELNIYSDANDPPNVSITSSVGGTPTQPLTHNNIEILLLESGNGVVNIIGDNNGAAAQNDVIVILGQDVDSSISEGGDLFGDNEFQLLIGGDNSQSLLTRAPIGVLNVQQLNITSLLGDDDIVIDPYANTTTPWNVVVNVDAGAGDDDLSYGNIIRNIFADDTPDGSQALVNEAVILDVTITPGAGSVTAAGVATITFQNTEDLSFLLNDTTLGDTDTLLIRTPDSAGVPETVTVNPDAAGTDADPIADIDATVGVQLLQVENFSLVNQAGAQFFPLAMYFDLQNGNDTFYVSPSANGVSVNVQGGSPTDDAAGDTLNMNFTGVTTPGLSLSAGPPSYDGSWAFGNRAAVNFTSMETISPTVTVTATTQAAEPATNGAFTFTRTGDTTLPLTVTYTVTGMATGGADYTTLTGTATFAANSSTVVVPVTVIDDLIFEGSETVIVTLTRTDPQPYVLGTADTATVTITDDDSQPTVSITADVSVTEGTTAEFTVSLSNPSTQTITVMVATAAGSAVPEADYATTTTILTFLPGQTSQTFSVATNDDLLDEAAETYTVNLSSPTNATLGTAIRTGTITDNDAAPSVSIDDVIVHESAGTATFAVTLDAPSGQTVTVNFTTAAGTAIASEDYTTTTGTLTFAPGVTSQMITVVIIDDAIDEPTQVFNVNLSAAGNATIGDGSGSGTIIDNDDAPTVSVSDATVTEGGQLSFTVTLSAASQHVITVFAQTADGTAVSPTDYSFGNVLLTFNPGQTSIGVLVSTIDDTIDEIDTEVMYLNLSNGVNVSIADGTGNGLINDNDAPPTISISSTPMVEEGLTAVFAISLSTASGLPISVQVHTVQGSASAGLDYVSATQVFTFAPGETSKSFSVATINDTLDEPTETFTAVLGSPTNATIATGTNSATIIDNDPPVAVPDAYTTNEDTTLTVSAPGVLTNDAYVAGSQVVLISTTSNGILTLNADGSFTYAPNGNFSGTDSFQYQVDDQSALNNLSNIVTATITVTAVADAPTLTATTPVTGNEGSAIPLTITAALVDTDGSEVITLITISGFPIGTTFNAGFNDNTTLAVTPAELTGLTMTVPDGGQSFTLQVAVTSTESSNGSAAASVATIAVTINNVVPTATLGNGGPVNESNTTTVSFTSQNDQSQLDTVAGFHYAYDFDDDGTFEVGNGTYAGSPSTATTVVPSSYLSDGPDTRVVRGRIIDKDGGFTEYTTTITIDNVAPTATFGVTGPFIPGQPMTVSFTNPADTSPEDQLAGFTYAFDLGTGSFGPAGTASTAIFTPPGPGTYLIRGRVFDKDGDFTEYQATTAGALPGQVVVPNVDLFAVGAGVDGGPIVHVYRAADNTLLTTIVAYEPQFRGGVNVAVADVTGDGIPDIITGTGPGGGPVVKVFDGSTFALVTSFFAYESTFRGGVRVAAGDINGGGVASIVAGSGLGGGPVVKAFNGLGAEELSFFAYDSSLRGGVNVGVAQINPTGPATILTGAGVGGGPNVRAFDNTGTQLLSFFAYESTFTGGVYVSGGLVGSGAGSIFTGTGLGGGPVLKQFDGLIGTEQKSVVAFGLDAYGRSLREGFTLSATHIAGPNGRPVVIVGAGPDYGPTVRVLDAEALTQDSEFIPFEESFQGGVFVG